VLSSIETAYSVMLETGDKKLAGKASMDELNGLHRRSQEQGKSDARFSQRARADDKEVAGLFRDLQDARGLGRVRALERVDAHPMAETIRRIDQEFMDILGRLDDAGLVKINCK